MLRKSCYRHNDDKPLSKLLSWLLRHGAVKECLNIGFEGYVDVTDIEQYRGFRNKYTVADIQRVVAESDKQRFTLRTHPISGKLQIKANQGHSIDFIQDSDLIPICHASEIPTVIHGTYFRNWTKIKTEGLSRMNRLHIHFSPGEPGNSQVISGLRSSCQLYIYIDAEKALSDGIQFYRSVNNVILSPGNSEGYIEPKYFSKVVDVFTMQEFKVTTMQNSTRCEICKVDTPDKESLACHILGKKHLRKLQHLQQKKDAEETGIYVTGFPKQTDQVELQTFFGQFGPIKKFVFGYNGRFAVIQFCERESVEMCISRILYFSRHRLRVKRQKVQDPPVKSPPPPEVVASEGLNHTRVTEALSSCKGDFQSQFSVLLNEIHVSDYSKYALVCEHLEATLSVSFPGCKAHPFGSAVTGLAFKGSDLDVFMDLNVAPAVFVGASAGASIPESQIIGVNRMKKFLQWNSDLYSNIFAIPKAKTPIVKFFHKPTKISCDLSFKNALGVSNSALIRFYLSVDPRIKPFLIVIKYWAGRNDLSGNGKISSYALAMIALFYLQQLEHPVIPTIAALQEGVNEKLIIDGWECSINTNISAPNNNTMSVPELLCGFFKFCSKFGYGLNVMCPLTGTSIPKSSFQTPEALPEAMHRYKDYMSNSDSDTVGLKVDSVICIQDPFELRHNIVAGMSPKALENFKKCCGSAALAYDKLSSVDAKTPSFLKKLLRQRIQNSEFLCHITIKLDNYLVHKLPENVDSRQHESTLNAGNELRKRWFKSVLEILIQIFKDVMKFDVHIEESEHSNSKIQKLDGQSNISEASNNVGVKVIRCCGYYQLWVGRRSAYKKLRFPEKLEKIARERMVSDYLYERLKRQASKLDSLVSFCCVFKPKQEPTRVLIELSDIKSHKKNFKVLSAFLQECLPAWIGKCMMYQQNEQQVDEKVV